MGRSHPRSPHRALRRGSGRASSGRRRAGGGVERSRATGTGRSLLVAGGTSGLTSSRGRARTGRCRTAWCSITCAATERASGPSISNLSRHASTHFAASALARSTPARPSASTATGSLRPTRGLTRMVAATVARAPARRRRVQTPCAAPSAMRPGASASVATGRANERPLTRPSPATLTEGAPDESRNP